MNVRVKISSTSIAETVINPVWSGEVSDKIERDRIYYLREIAGDFVLRGADFALVNDLTNECEVITVTIEYYCDPDWIEYFTGTFTKFDCKFDLVKCTLSAKIKPDTLYQCLFDNWEAETNIYNNTGAAIIVRAFFGTYESGIQCCEECRATPDTSPVCSSTTACEEDTIAYPNSDMCNPSEYLVVTCFHRVTAVSASGPPAYGTGWTLLSGTTYWRCPDGEPFVIGVLRYGRRFDAVLEHLVSQTGCGLTVRSHFFGINATHDAPPANDAYAYASDYYQDMTVHQKSDVKRPDGDPSFSFIWKMKLRELLSDLQTIFNVFWKIEGTDLIIEHISYFEAAAGADYTNRKIPLQIDYELESPKEEKFLWSDEDATVLFLGDPITYNCGNGTKERRVTLFSTDVEFVRNEAYQDRVSDDKWVLISNTVDGSTYFINRDVQANDPLSWTNLHDKLHRHYRPFSSGSLNGSNVTFISTQPIKKQPEFTVPFCCGDIFDASNYVTTAIGQGRVQSATVNFKKETVKLQLNY